MLGRLVGLGEPRPEPADRALAGELLDGVEAAPDHPRLVLLVVDRSLLVAVAHELPPRVLARLRDARVVHAHARVDRHRRPDLQARVERVEAPEADAHAVLVPAPVGHVGQERRAGRRRQHLARHRARDVPDLEVDDGPDDDALAGRELQLRPVDDGGIGDAVARNGHLRFLAFALSLAFAFATGASGSASLSMRIALPKYTLRRSSSLSLRSSMVLMISRMNSGPPSGSKGQSVPKSTWSAP